MTSASGDRPTARFPEVISFPPETLARHRARMLEPPSAPRAADGTWPLPTAYRADSLLPPARDLLSLLPDEPNDHNRELEPLGVELRPSRDEGWLRNLRAVHP